mgnify:CR=1 FL=1
MEQDVLLKAQAFDLLMAQLPVGLAVLDQQQRYLAINDRLAQFHSIPAADHLGHSVETMLPDLYPAIAPMLAQVLETGQPLLNFEINNSPVSDNAGVDSTAHWFGSYLPLYGDGQQVQGVLVIALNQTMEWGVQQRRQQDLDKLRQVLDSMFAFVGILAPDGTVQDANRAPLELAGITLTDVRNKKFWDCFWWTHDAAEAARIKEAVELAQRGITSRFDVSVQMQQGIIDIDFMLAPMFDAEGSICNLIPSGIEITDRKRSEQQLKHSELRFRRVFDSVADGLISVDRHGHISLVNSRALEMFGYQQHEMIGQPIELLVPQDKIDGHHHSRQQYLQNPSTRPMAELKELFARRRDGSLFPVEIGLTYLEGDSKVSVLATVTDVTDAKAVQRDLQQIVHDKSTLLAERTALLNEVHHRVKNNLQVMSSLLSLQSRNAAPELKQAFAESQMRVRTMALTHQLLYENRNFSSVPLAVYLEQLCRLIQQTLAPASQIRFSYDGMDSKLLLDLELTIPCGLLVNEVVTNSLKHAFVKSAAEGGPAERGEVSLGLQALADGRYQLQISDNGIGMPAQAQLGSGASMGMQLIPAFIAQLNAELQLQRQPGTCYRISFYPQKEAR